MGKNAKIVRGPPNTRIAYRCRNCNERSVMPVLTCGGNLEARVFGYMNGASLSARIRSSGSSLFSNSFRTPLSDLSYSTWTNDKRCSFFKYLYVLGRVEAVVNVLLPMRRERLWKVKSMINIDLVLVISIYNDFSVLRQLDYCRRLGHSFNGWIRSANARQHSPYISNQ